MGFRFLFFKYMKLISKAIHLACKRMVYHFF